jgi:hypothetical protein
MVENKICSAYNKFNIKKIKGVEMRKLYWFVFLLIASMLMGCEDDSMDTIGLKELGIDQSKGEINNYVDTHGSLGDGVTYIEIKFSGDNAEDVESNLKDNENWIKLPLSNQLNTALYGTDDYISLLQSSDELPSIPEVSKGYYYFRDRYSDSMDSKEDAELLGRGSMNFDVVIYDIEKQILYIIQIDT